MQPPKEHTIVHKSKALCKKCIKGYANEHGYAIDKWDISKMTFTLLVKCEDCGANTYCHILHNAHFPSNGGDPSDDSITKIAALDLDKKPKPAATNKRDARKRHMKHNNKPKGNQNMFTRRKT